MNAIHCEGVVADAAGGRWPGPLDLRLPVGAFCVVQGSSALGGPLLRLCAGLRHPLRGRVQVLGANPAALNRREARHFRGALGAALRPGGLISNLTLRMNLTVPLLYSGDANPAEAARRADQMLDLVGIAGWANFRPADVAEDVREQGVIARALIREPQLLLLENPLAALAEDEAARLVQLCRERARTVLVTSPQAERLFQQQADHYYLWNETGLHEVSHEVGTY